MAKRSISKNFRKDTEIGEIYDWLGLQLPSEMRNNGELDCLTQTICVTINLDPNRKGSIIPEGPKISHHRARTRP